MSKSSRGTRTISSNNAAQSRTTNAAASITQNAAASIIGHAFTNKQESQIFSDIDNIEKELGLTGMVKSTSILDLHDIEYLMGSNGLTLTDSAKHALDSLNDMKYGSGYLNSDGNKKYMQELQEQVEDSVHYPSFYLSKKMSPKISHRVSIKPSVSYGSAQKYKVTIEAIKDKGKKGFEYETKKYFWDKKELAKGLKKYAGKENYQRFIKECYKSMALFYLFTHNLLFSIKTRIISVTLQIIIIKW